MASLADTIRFATYHASFSRKGPGLLLRDLSSGRDEDLLPAIETIQAADPDVLLLTRLDYDAAQLALKALNTHLGYPHLFTLKPNTGMATGHDIDGNGKLGEPRDAQGYGWFAGQGGMAILSRLPIQERGVEDLSGLLWRDLPGTKITADDPAYDVQRLSSSGHWVVPLRHASGVLNVFAFAATPPVFDGPEDRNGRRNHDEIALWQKLLDGELPFTAEGDAFVLMGNANLDPDRGEGLHIAIQDLLNDKRLQDPKAHMGQATAHWRAREPGPLRVGYTLPSAGLEISAAGLSGTPTKAQPHQLVWVDVRVMP